MSKKTIAFGNEPKLEVDFSDLKKVLEDLEKGIKKKGKKEKDDWEWDLKIARVSNAYVLDGIADTGNRKKLVIKDDDMDELKSHQRLLWEVMDYFGFGGTKHDKERIKIIREEQK